MSMTVTCAKCKGPLEVSDATVEELTEEFGHVPRRLKHVECPAQRPDLRRYVTEIRVYGGPNAPRMLDPTDEHVPVDADALVTGFRVEVEAVDFESGLEKLAVALGPHWERLQKSAALIDEAIDANDPVIEVDGG